MPAVGPVEGLSGQATDPDANQGLNAEIARKVLFDHFGFNEFRGIQQAVILSVMAGRDTLALMPTGAGKSICYQVPGVASGKLCLVISPLIALMQDQVKGLKERGLRAAHVTSGMRHQEIDVILDNAVHGPLQFLFVSPERLATDLFKARFARMDVGLITVDEAHCISQWGHDFRPAYRKISELRTIRPDVPILALTASATVQVAGDIMEQLEFKDGTALRSSAARPELVYWLTMRGDKMQQLERIAKRNEGSGIVYVKDRRSTVRISQWLRSHGIRAAPYHAGLDMAMRNNVQTSWTTGEIPWVVATNAFGMGIDKSDVRTVVHMDPPADLESYYQEAGRAGRDQNKAYAIMIADHNDGQLMRERVEGSFPSRSEIRQVFQAFCDMHRIAFGAGADSSYALDVQKIRSRTGLDVRTIINSFKILELQGLAVLSEGARSPSRVMIKAHREIVHSIRLKEDPMGKVLSALLRCYAGIFEAPTIIEEERIARVTDLSLDGVQKVLAQAHQQEVILYRKRTDGPEVTLLNGRPDAAKLEFDHAVLEGRKQRALERADAMIDYLNTNDTCRQRILQQYFGDAASGDCGHCDICIKNAHALDPEGHKTIKRRILDRLKVGPIDVVRLISDLKAEPVQTRAVVRWMLDADQIILGEDQRLYSKPDHVP